MPISRRSLVQILLIVGFIGVALALGFLVSQSWFALAFIGLMMSMHLFGHGGHGGHGGGHSHGGSEEETSEGDEGRHHGS